MADPGDKAHDEFRRCDAGNGVSIPVNSKAGTSNFYVDRDRLRRTNVTDYVPASKPGTDGKFVNRVETASIMDNARDAAGRGCAKSSFECLDEKKPSRDYNYAVPSSPYYGNQNPLTRRRGDE